MSARVRVARAGEVRLEADGTITVPLMVAESGRGGERAALQLTVAEAEVLHAQLTRALSPPVPLRPSPWLYPPQERHEDPRRWP